MPPDLRKAHDTVDRLYRKQPFASDADRVAHLFTHYQQLTDPSAEGATLID